MRTADPRLLFYGQIRDNYTSLLSHYGHEPPWPMYRSPHVDLVEAVRDGKDPEAYCRYLSGHHDDPEPVVEEQVGRVAAMLKEPEQYAKIKAGCVADGNHRVAVAIVTGCPLNVEDEKPYQEIIFPGGARIPGRRETSSRWPIPYDFRGRIVTDLGCSEGMNAVMACLHGADRAEAYDRDLTSATWYAIAAWGVSVNVTVYDLAGPAHPRFYVPADRRVVLALGIAHHLRPERFAEIVRDSDVIWEGRTEESEPPDTGHAWRLAMTVPYSVAEPERHRRVYIGVSK